MFWAPCLRVDFPVDAPRAYVRALGQALDDLVTLVEETSVAHVSLALSAAALTALEREKFVLLLDRIWELATDARIELLGTAAHGAFLPLLPEDEIARQIALTDRINRRFFGDAWHPATFWPPGLGFSQKVANVAASLDYSVVLVDEAAMRLWPSRWPGNRIDALDTLPGMFLLPRSRPASEAFGHGAITSASELGQNVPDGVNSHAYVVTTTDLTPRSASDVALRLAGAAVRTVRVEQLFSLFPLSHATSPLPCSQESTAAELGHGLPFASWFSPDNESQALHWKLMTSLTEVFHDLERRGLKALPASAELREAIDRGWRESYWRSADPGIEPLRQATAGVREFLEPQRYEALSHMFDALELPMAEPGEPVAPADDQAAMTLS